MFPTFLSPRTLLRAAAAVALVPLASCGGGDGGGGTPVDPTPQVVASVTVSPDAPALIVGEQRQLTATAYDAAGKPASGIGMSWASSDTTRVRVSPSGMVTAVALGSASVTATAGGKAGQATVSVGVGAPAQLVKVTADAPAQIGDTRTLQVRVTDAGGSPVKGQAVAWAVTQGNGTLAAAASATNDAGIAQTDWTLGTTAGPQAVSATASFTQAPAVFSAAVQPGAADLTRSLVTTNAQALTANGADQATVTVQLRDAYGNPLTSSAGTVALAANTGTLGPVSDHGDGNYTATYTAPTRTGQAAVSATLNGVALLKAATLQLKAGPIVAYSVNATHASPSPTDFAGIEASPVDAFGNQVPANGRVVTWTTTGGTLGLATSVLQTGYTTNTLTVGTVAGTQYRVTVRDAEGFTGTSNVITVVPGAISLTHTTVTASPSAIPADGKSTLTVTVQVKDNWDNNTPTDGVTFVSVQSSLGTVSGPHSLGGGTHQATLTSGTLVANTVQVTAKIGGSLVSDVETVQFTAGGATQCWIGVSTRTPAAGTAQAVYVRVLDANGNAAPQGGRTLTWSSTGGGSFAPASVTTDSNGEASTQFTASATPGVTHTLSAHDTAGGFTCSSPSVVTQ